MTRSAAHAGATHGRRRRGVDLAANAWTRTIVRQALTGRWEPWLTWLHDAFTLLPGVKPASFYDDPVRMWHNAREAVLWSLAELELEVTVLRTDSPIPNLLAEHHADVAGLVHVHRDQGDFAWTPPIPAEILVGQSQEARYCRAMLDRHGLLPAMMRVPTSLRAFCGQEVDAGAETLAIDLPGNDKWRDHLHAWTTATGAPVLTVEPYVDDAPDHLEAIRRAIASRRLPLTVEGPAVGVWAERTQLYFLRHDRSAAASAAAFTPQDIAVTWHGGQPRKVWENGSLVYDNGRGLLPMQVDT